MKPWIRSALLLATCSGLQAAEPAGGNADIATLGAMGGFALMMVLDVAFGG